ncbi:hypothetical protein TrLO_g4546 [Triparma laevis f. longispina]|uniref:Uncharacterized protein n=1 Tax=Triparma laevis f. longispina TaxID=1714387 RepID=A0A9W6ZE48_9STRA|nr:hypothetical protein TrLO_g4546 [Triparma laevis f. longispina]
MRTCLLLALLLFCTTLRVTAFTSSSWQARLDKALLSVDTSPETRVRNLQKALKDPQLKTDLQKATELVRTKGSRSDIRNLLFPSGTIARSDLEGLEAIKLQVPELRKELRTQFKGSRKNKSKKPKKQNSVNFSKPDFTLPKPDEIKDEFKNIFRSTPKGLKQPDYKVIRSFDDKIELRLYDSYKIAKTDSASGEGFNTLASYIFGGNERDEKMQMTTPVLTTEGSMSFILSVDEEPPTPQDDSVTIETIPTRIVAVKTFPGLVTVLEVERQTQTLIETLKIEGVAVLEDVEPFVLQYNAPLTIPWRRRNEIAVVCDGVEEDFKSSWYDRKEGEVTSWFDAGVRL